MKDGSEQNGGFFVFFVWLAWRKSISEYPLLHVLFWKSAQGNLFTPSHSPLSKRRPPGWWWLTAQPCFIVHSSLYLLTPGMRACFPLSEYAMSAEGSLGPAHFNNLDYCAQKRLAAKTGKMPPSPPAARLPAQAKERSWKTTWPLHLHSNADAGAFCFSLLVSVSCLLV